MKIAHIADLHIGRRFEDVSLVEDQRFIFAEIIKTLRLEHVDVLLIAGDVYDKVSPSAEAFDLWNDFLERLVELDCHVIVIAGNHDSRERLGVGRRLLGSQKVHIITSLVEALTPIVIHDDYGDVFFYAIPFLKPIDVRNSFDEPTIVDYPSAFSFVIDRLELNPSARNILIAHQFFVNGSQNPLLSDSEVPSVGGLDAIDVSGLEIFDYCAFGHIHGPQKVMTDTIRYSGSPLKYSFSEVNHHKSIPLIRLEDKGMIYVDYIPLKPLHDVRIIKGELEDLLAVGRLEPSHDFIKAIITDEDDVYNAMGKLASVYPNTVSLEVQNSATLSSSELLRADAIIKKSHVDRFNDLFEIQNNRPLDEEEISLVNELFMEVSSDETN